LLYFKGVSHKSQSAAAEGGIAAYIPGNSDPNDNPDYMTYDTVKGGDYLVDQDAAEYFLTNPEK